MMDKTSSITKHYLSSMLPFSPSQSPQQITKTKQFYKPEQFIWNNPHRTSKRMYQFYHKGNQLYKNKVKPEIDRMIQKDMHDNQGQRIHRLTVMKNQTRNRFYSRQKQRMQIQSKVGSRKYIDYSERFHKTEVKIDQTQFIYSKNNFLQQNSKIKKTPHSQLNLSKLNYSKDHMSPSKTKKSYYDKVNLFDEQAQHFQKACTEQMLDKHNKIRGLFKAQKKSNEDIYQRIKNTIDDKV